MQSASKKRDNAILRNLCTDRQRINSKYFRAFGQIWRSVGSDPTDSKKFPKSLFLFKTVFLEHCGLLCYCCTVALKTAATPPPADDVWENLDFIGRIIALYRQGM